MDAAPDNPSLLSWWRTTALGGVNASYLEAQFEQYLADPASVAAPWRAFFDSLPRTDGPDISHDRVRDGFRLAARRFAAPAGSAPRAVADDAAPKQVRVLQLINAYRFRGHQAARLDPLGLAAMPAIPELTLEHHGLGESDLDSVFETGSFVGPRTARLRELLAALTQTYVGAIGAEYMHITDTQEKRWLQNCLESVRGVPTYPPEVRRNLLARLTAAEGLEHFLHAKYVGQKRFSLEGAESLIPALDEIIQRAGDRGVKEVVLGMAHRGRLNVLVNILGKQPADLFREFEGRHADHGGTGDVKYHMGFSADVATPGGTVHLALAFNPSHLEIVAPVVQGSVRARQERRRDRTGGQVLPVVIHGDAAFAGQGVVMETFNLAALRGYTTHGTVHVVVNNQIGFTTSLAQDARSTFYCTDVAKTVNAPIFHVNGDDPEACLFVAQLALDYRMTFRKDVVIDLVCYRRHGHSEADEPTVTQPLMYRRIKQLPTTRARYGERLAAEAVVEPGFPADALREYQDALAAGADVAPHRAPPAKAAQSFGTDWRPYLGGETDLTADTGLPLATLRAQAEPLLRWPDGFAPHASVAKIYDNRRKMVAGALPVDWGAAETLAYASLLHDGYGVRLSGQDSGRGTFFHRHAIVYNVDDGTAYVPLRKLFDGQPDFTVVNSPLTEAAVLAFEYGFATAEPKTLTIWEAQFGDFANNAQVVIDQFISAGEQKWNRLCGLTLFLPHGYEGQGPEHSSARPERYLQLCAQHNLIAAVPTTPAQFFHLLRRQMRSRVRKPLIVMTPKSLLRHRLAVSAIDELAQGGFQTVLGAAGGADPSRVSRVVLCTGKVYYDLLEQCQARGRADVALVRLEQLYPFPQAELQQQLARYPNARRYVWCQEEPMNQGAWYSIQHHLWPLRPAGSTLDYAGRPLLAAPAVGNFQLHVQQLKELLDQALGPAV